MKKYFKDNRDINFVANKKEDIKIQELWQFSYQIIKGTSKTYKDHIINLLKIEGNINVGFLFLLKRI